MHTIHLRWKNADGSAYESACGTVTATPTRRWVDEADDHIVLPEPVTVLVDGEGTITLPGSGAGWAWRFTWRPADRRVRGWSEVVLVPDEEGTSEYTDLTVVDPDSLTEPAAEPAWWDALEDVKNSTVEGPQGPQGEPGPQGPQGEPGPPGKDGVDGLDYVPSDTDWPTVRVRAGDPVDDLDALPPGETRVYESEANAPLAYMLDIGSLSGATKTGNKVAQVTTMIGPATVPARLEVVFTDDSGGTSTGYTDINVPTAGSIEQVAELRDGSTVRRVFFDQAAALAAEAANPLTWPIGDDANGKTVTSRTVTFADAVTDWEGRIRPGSFLAAYDHNSPQMEKNFSAVVGEYGVTQAYGVMLHLGGPHRLGGQMATYQTYRDSTGVKYRTSGTTFPTFGLGARLAVSNPPVNNTGFAIDPRFMSAGHTTTANKAVTRHIVTVNDGRVYNIPVYVGDRCDLITWKALHVARDGTTTANQPVSVTGVPAAGPGWAQVLCFNHNVQVVWLTQADEAASA